MKELKERQDELYINISDINSDILTDSDEDIRVTDLEWTNNLYKCEFASIFGT